MTTEWFLPTVIVMLIVMGLAINNIKSEHTLYFVLDFMILFLLSPSSGTAKICPLSVYTLNLAFIQICRISAKRINKRIHL